MSIERILSPFMYRLGNGEGVSLEANKIIKIDWQKLAELGSGLAPFQRRIKTLTAYGLGKNISFFKDDQ